MHEIGVHKVVNIVDVDLRISVAVGSTTDTRFDPIKSIVEIILIIIIRCI